jgi:two-component system sensor kinase FixL
MTMQSTVQVRDLAGDLEAARARLSLLKSQNARLSRLTAMERVALDFAHELNQPLAAVVNYIRAGQAFEVRRTRFREQSLHASQIVNRVRSFVTRGETGKTVERIAAIVQAAMDVAVPGTEPHGVEISLIFDPAADLVLVDRLQIQQVLVNLICNAVQAMQDTPRRALCIASRLSGNVVEVSVTDSGAGVSMDVADRLFEPFVTTRRNGTGLGLTICHAIIEAHGGTLSYEPAQDGGSIFRFTVTAAADPLP